MFSKVVGLFLILITITACAQTPYNNLDNKQLKAMLDKNVPIFDIRRPEEWRQTGVVEGSQLMTFVDRGGVVTAGFLDRFTAKVGKDEPVILICRTGNRTSRLARHLVENMGYTQVYNVRDGITEWIRGGQPTVRL